MSFLYASYFSTIIVYSLFYLFNSFHAVLPWTYCRDQETELLNDWATENCTDKLDNVTSKDSVPVTQEYFDNYVLHKTSGIEEVSFFRFTITYITSFKHNSIVRIHSMGAIRYSLSGLGHAVLFRIPRHKINRKSCLRNGHCPVLYSNRSTHSWLYAFWCKRRN